MDSVLIKIVVMITVLNYLYSTPSYSLLIQVTGIQLQGYNNCVLLQNSKHVIFYFMPCLYDPGFSNRPISCCIMKPLESIYWAITVIVLSLSFKLSASIESD